MRSRLLYTHSVLLMWLCLNSFVLLAAACLKTVSVETVNPSVQLASVPLRRQPVLSGKPSADYSAHVQQFRAAKLFRTQTPTETAFRGSEEVEVTDELASTSVETRPSRREEIKKSAKIFAAKTDERSDKTQNKEEEVENQGEPGVLGRDDNNDVHDDRDLFEALRVEKPDICGSCPLIWMKNSVQMKEVCSNHESVSTFFSMNVDKRDAKNVVDSSDFKECTRTITCSEPHMLIKWHESELCDVHAPSTGSLVSDSSNNFVFKCNGTHWTMHGFPLSSVVCAVTAN